MIFYKCVWIFWVYVLSSRHQCFNNIKNIVLAGGVAANSALRAHMKMKATENNITVYYPSLALCTDNAAMIGSAAYYSMMKGIRSNFSLNATPSIAVGEKPNKGFYVENF